MKRALLVFLLILLLGGAGAAWWFLRDSPDKVLRDTIVSLGQVKTIRNSSLDVSWLDAQSRATTGFTTLAQLDLKDISQPQAIGVIRLAARSVNDQDQLLDIVLGADTVAFRPEDISPYWMARYRDVAGTTSSRPFLSINRDSFFQTLGYGGALSKGKDAALRQLLPSLQPTMYATSPLETSQVGDRTFVSLRFRFLRDGFQPLLIAWAGAWKGNATLNAKDYAFIEQVADNALAGDFRVTLDATTRQVVRLEGNWPDMNSKDGLAQVRFVFDLDGVNQGVAVVVPKDALNVTAKFAPESVPSFLPNAGTRAGYIAPTSSAETVIPSEPRNIDAFSDYYDELKRRGLIGGVKRK